MGIALPRDGTPFVLLDDARATGAAPARLYTDPVEIVVTRRLIDVPHALFALRTATQGGLHAAGYLTYEAGYALEPTLLPHVPALSQAPLLWFGLFRGYDEIAADDVPALLPDPAGAWIGAPEPEIARETYEGHLAQVQALIAAGDIYQANLTFGATVQQQGSPLALYAGLRARAKAGYGGIVRTRTATFLSLSPELFFACDGARILTRPMKGTLPRDADPALLPADEKQRAENLMIVDLLRNDLSRVAVPGSVAVPELFRVETYPTVHQMTSTVTAAMRDDIDVIDVIQRLYPCGSITGAPKIRAMEAICDVEAGPRGIYTGSIGRIDAGGRAAAFNVAIRTLTLGEGAARIGLGSGIVADSSAEAEWDECIAKGAFVASDRQFDLIETMAFDPMDGLVRLDAHLARMKASAMQFGFTFDRHAARNDLQAATIRLRNAARVRLVLARTGAVAIDVRPMPARPQAPVDVAVVSLPVEAADFRLRHKTSDRAFYDDARRTAGTFEVVFADAQDCLTEGSFTNIFVERDGALLTPPLTLGLLGGILRQTLLESGQAREATLRVDDLSNGFFVGNSLRGLLPAHLSEK